MEIYTKPTYFINSDHPEIINFTNKHTESDATPTLKAISLYCAIRDGIRYHLYDLDLSHKAMQASEILNRPSGTAYCVEKACLLAACGRAAHIPTRMGFANVRNHIGSEKMEIELGTNLLVFHGYMEFFLDNKWIKATPAFNKSLCEHLNVAPLEFDGKSDSFLQEYDNSGQVYMEFEHDYGHFHDVPHDLFMREIIRYYPHLFSIERLTKIGQPFHIQYYNDSVRSKSER